MSSSYHEGHRRLQDRFDARRIADRLEAVTYHAALSERDREIVGSADMFFLATADTEGNPDCSYKGGDPGFVRVLSDTELAWPDYDGNGQFRSLGNLVVNPALALLFVDWQRPARLRIHGRARLSFDHPALATMPGAQLLVTVSIDRVFPNCPRYVHTMERVKRSPYVPGGEEPPPVPGWKLDERFADALPSPARHRGKADE
jgi:predicted pyridoxine 5'-phosphate oxidase superfamily flavin-nucleotide-binding protein